MVKEMTSKSMSLLIIINSKEESKNVGENAIFLFLEKDVKTRNNKGEGHLNQSSEVKGGGLLLRTQRKRLSNATKSPLKKAKPTAIHNLKKGDTSFFKLHFSQLGSAYFELFLVFPNYGH